MKKIAGMLTIVVALAGAGAQAAEYSQLRCSDMINEPDWAAHVVGWLNLVNRDRQTQDLNFDDANKSMLRLQITCRDMPDLMVYQAVLLTFPVMAEDLEGAQYKVPAEDARSATP